MLGLTKNGPRMTTLRSFVSSNVAYRIVDLAHVKDRSQATLRRKRRHHDLMHGLTNPRIRVSK
jgi:hypothetical protein